MSGEAENLSDMSDEQLEAALDGSATDTEPFDTTIERPAQKVEEAVEEPEQPEEAAPEAVEAEAQEEEAVEEPAPEPETESPEPEVDLSKEELEARLAESEARERKWEQIAGRHGGKIGFLEKQLQNFMQQQTATVDESIEGIEEPHPPTRPAPQRQPEKVVSWMVNQAIQNGMQEFAAAHPDANKYAPAMQAYIKEIGWDAGKVMTTDDPAVAQAESRRVLEEAYWHAEAEAHAERRKELATKRAEQTAELTKEKQKAAPSATAAAPPPKPKPKTLQELDDGELEAELDKAAAQGGRWY